MTKALPVAANALAQPEHVVEEHDVVQVPTVREHTDRRAGKKWTGAHGTSIPTGVC